MKNQFLTVFAAVALLSLPGCCGGPGLCMTPCACPNPYWMEDLQADYCQTAGCVKAKLCQFQRSVNCQMCQLKTRLTACNSPACNSTTVARPCQPATVTPAAPKSTEKCELPERSEVACDAPSSKCQERCRRCKQQPCRCGACDCSDQISFNSQRPALPEVASFGQPSCAAPANTDGNQSAPMINPAPRESISVPPVPLSNPVPPSSGPKKTMGPTPIPVPDPKINPAPGTNSASSSNPPPAIIPPADPSIALEDRTNLSHVGFRRSDPNRPIYNGWKPVTELPKVLR